ARAYRDATSESQRMAIARAAFGRQGAIMGPVLGTIADKGLPSQSDLGISDAQIKEFARLRAQVEETEKRARNILASIFTKEGLDLALAAAERMERFAKAAKDAADQREGLGWFQSFFAGMTRQAIGESDLTGSSTKQFDESMAMVAARQRMAAGTGTGNLAANPKDAESWMQLGDAMRGILSPAEQAERSMKQLQDAAAAAASQEKERIGLLGNAATADEKRVATLTELTSAFLDNKLSAESY